MMMMMMMIMIVIVAGLNFIESLRVAACAFAGTKGYS
jgi:hypothetical protein